MWHIDNDTDEIDFVPLCRNWTKADIEAGTANLQRDHCFFSHEDHVDSRREVCPECLEHPDLPLLILKHTELE